MKRQPDATETRDAENYDKFANYNHQKATMTKEAETRTNVFMHISSHISDIAASLTEEESLVHKDMIESLKNATNVDKSLAIQAVGGVHKGLLAEMEKHIVRALAGPQSYLPILQMNLNKFILKGMRNASELQDRIDKKEIKAIKGDQSLPTEKAFLKILLQRIEYMRRAKKDITLHMLGNNPERNPVSMQYMMTDEANELHSEVRATKKEVSLLSIINALIYGRTWKNHKVDVRAIRQLIEEKRKKLDQQSEDWFVKVRATEGNIVKEAIAAY